jgi:hypothetical protein
MQNAARILIIAAAALTACHKQQPANVAENQDMSLESNLATGQVPDNAQIETLPADESSATTSGELNAGDDNPDVNNLGNGH